MNLDIIEHKLLSIRRLMVVGSNRQARDEVGSLLLQVQTANGSRTLAPQNEQPADGEVVLTEYEVKVLRFMAGYRDDSIVSGAAVQSAMARLKGLGLGTVDYDTGSIGVTTAGLKRLGLVNEDSMILSPMELLVLRKIGGYSDTAGRPIGTGEWNDTVERLDARGLVHLHPSGTALSISKKGIAVIVSAEQAQEKVG